MKNAVESTAIDKLRKILKILLAFIQGLVRPVLAISFGEAVIWGFINGLISLEVFIGIASLVVGFYFNSREKEKKKCTGRTCIEIVLC